MDLFFRNKFIHSSLTPYAAIFIILIASGSSTFPATQTIVLLAFGPLIFSLAAASKKEFIRKCLENRILVVLGGASYTLYLLQFPMRKYIAFWVPDPLALYARLAFAPVLICTSVFVFLYYEGPMRKLLRRAFERAAQT